MLQIVASHTDYSRVIIYDCIMFIEKALYYKNFYNGKLYRLSMYAYCKAVLL